MKCLKLENQPLFRLLSRLPSRRKIQFFIVVLALIGASASKGLLVLSIGPFLVAVSGSTDIGTSQDGGISEIMGNLYNTSWIACLVFGVLAISAALFGVASSWAISRYTNCLALDITEETLKASLYEPYVLQTRRNSSHTMSDIERAKSLSTNVFSPYLQLFGSLLTVSTTLVVAFYANWRASSIAILLGGSIYLLTAAKTRKILTSDGELLLENSRHGTRLLREAYDGIRDIILDQKHHEVISEQVRLNKEALQTKVRSGLVHSVPRYVLEGTGYLLLAAFGLIAIVTGKYANFNLATIGTLALAMQNLLPNIQQVFSCWSSYKTGEPSIYSILDFLELDEKENRADPSWPQEYVADQMTKSEANTFNRMIVLKNVCFSYEIFEKTNEIDYSKGISGVNLRISKGEIIGIVGKTGSGKSTLIDVIMGLLPLHEGDLTVDGESIHKNQRERMKWLENISHVPQKIHLSDKSVLENIADLDQTSDIDMSRVQWAADSAQVSEFVDKLPNKWATKIGEQGIRLSGGQRQRLGLARAIYRQRPVLVLDEATSALDSHTEKKVITGIMRMTQKPTILMVAHRLSTLEMCDRILMMDRGKIIEEGQLHTIQHALNLANK